MCPPLEAPVAYALSDNKLSFYASLAPRRFAASQPASQPAMLILGGVTSGGGCTANGTPTHWIFPFCVWGCVCFISLAIPFPAVASMARQGRLRRPFLLFAL
jgi:hypothetical protein